MSCSVSDFKKLEERIAALEAQANKETKPRKPRKPSEYNLFIKKQYPVIQKENPGKDQKEIFALIVEKWREHSKKE
jgi:hypothetical protein